MNFNNEILRKKKKIPDDNMLNNTLYWLKGKINIYN